ncbi:endo-1,4-beta-xylanase [Lederbergia galactosidilyticus]|uniref:endo-1,4-beta-xylanase n=1 Tax=Lederbergia galactosidilytica TaxID=217031 RepID=UPI001AE5EC0D|nr:endo-1,4-beta-xylanase [Lederbergia galactosidilytica]
MRRRLKLTVSSLLIAILIIQLGQGLQVVEAEEQEVETNRIFHETFAEGLGIVLQAGNAQLETVSDVTFTGNDDGKAVHISGRTNNWDGVDIKFNDIGMEKGKTYTFTMNGYVDESERIPEGGQAWVQIPSGDYPLLASADFIAGQAFTMTAQYTVDTGEDTSLRIQSNDEAKTVPFYIGEILITEQVSVEDKEEPEEQRPAPDTFTTITFEDQSLAGFAGRGDTETLTITDEENHTDGGKYALKVENRTKEWNGPSLRVESYIDKGKEYNISAWIKLISPESAQLQLSTQVGSEGHGASYNNLQGKTISREDGWVQLEGTYRYSSVGDEYVTIYIESTNNSTAAFYIDDIRFELMESDPVDIDEDLTAIRDVYQNYFYIGNAVSTTDLEGSRLELLKGHHNLVTAENAMKPSYAYNEQREFDFTAEDALVDKALAEGLKVHGHVLVWHQQSPEWLYVDENGAPLSRKEALENLRIHVKTVVEHFGPNVISWDVVNEAMNDNPTNPSDWEASLRQSGWYKAIGSDYIEQAFRIAKEVINEKDWEIKLYYNDYNDDNQNKAEAIYQMVKEINENYAAEHNGDILIDGIGMQGHYNLNTNPENVRRSLEKFISLGVEVGVTELDITAGADNELTKEQANAQGYLYAQLFQIYKEYADHISRVTFWGLNDATSWRAAQSPLLFDRNMQAKPAYYAVIDPDKFMKEHGTSEREVNYETALFGTPVIDGTIDEVWNKTSALPIQRYQTAWHGANGIAKALWDEENLYVLFQVSDSSLDQSNPEAYEQDSVEVFLDENNAKTSFYEKDDGQYRVNFENETTFNPESIEDGFASATHVSGNGYIVEMKIPFKTVTPENNMQIGFDVQINDAQAGSRQSIATWNDTTGVGYQDPSVFGILTLEGLAETPDEETPGGTDPEGTPGDQDPDEMPGGTEPNETTDGKESGQSPSGKEQGKTQDEDIQKGTPKSGGSTATKDGSLLPNTATNIFNWLFLGFVMLLGGCSAFFIIQRRNV